MLAEGLDRVLVFEDDVEPDFSTLTLLPDTLQQLPDDWELVYLGFLKNGEISAWASFRAEIKNVIALFL